MVLRGLPFLIPLPQLCEVFGISRWTLRDRIDTKAYPLIEWVKDGGKLKAVRPTVEDQIKAMKVEV
jgi:hypothetical protein